MTLLTIGPVHQLVQNEIYAMPGRRVWVFSGAAIEVANLEAGPWTALTGANTIGAESVAAFVRCPGAATTLIAKA